MLAASAAAALLLLRPQKAASAVRAGLALCAGTVVPSLFPFFAAISLLLQLGAAEALGRLCAPIMRPLFRMRGVCALPLLAGLLGGYPSGAKTAASLYAQGRITRQEAELLLGFCDNCGPAFLLGCVGAGVLGDPGAGAALFATRTGAPLIPVYIQPKKRRFRPTRVVFGQPYHPQIAGNKATSEELQQIACDLMARIQALGEEAA